MRNSLNNYLEDLSKSFSPLLIYKVLKYVNQLNNLYKNECSEKNEILNKIIDYLNTIEKFVETFDGSDENQQKEIYDTLKRFNDSIIQIIKENEFEEPEKQYYRPVNVVELNKAKQSTNDNSYLMLADCLLTDISRIEAANLRSIQSVIDMVKLILYFYEPKVLNFSKQTELNVVKFNFKQIIISLKFLSSYLEKHSRSSNREELTELVEQKCRTVREIIESIDNEELTEFVEQKCRAARKYIENINKFHQKTTMDLENDENVFAKCKNEIGKGWKKGIEKYKGIQTDLFMSPVRQINAVLQSKNFGDDIRFQGHVWVLNMTEQFYYDNVLVMLSKNIRENKAIKKALRLNYTKRNVKTILTDWVDVVPLGSGAFGSVIKVHDKVLHIDLAIKILKKSDGETLYHNIDSLMTYFVERNYLIKARESPYVVKFYQSLTIPTVSGLFLVFECCYCDLSKFLKFMKTVLNRPKICDSIWKLEKNKILEYYREISIKTDINVQAVVMVYIFELFCILDYLAKCNIVHNDIKPQNIMIGANLHLKLGDFGLVFNQQYVTAYSKRTLLKYNQLDKIDEINFRKRIGGTLIYMDIEEIVGKLKNYFQLFYFYLKSHPNLSVMVEEQPGDFLSDLWSIGLVAVELLLCGTRFFYELSKSVLSQMGAPKVLSSGGYEELIIPFLLTLLKYNYNRYIVTGLVKIGGPILQDLMKFLASIFCPREIRAAHMRRSKMYINYSKKISKYYVDISKLEKLDVFKNLKINTTNVFMYTIDEGMKSEFENLKEPTHDNLEEYIKSNKDSEKRNFLPMKPGIDLII